MPAWITPPIPIDAKRARLLRDLRLKIANNLWNGSSGTNLNAGTIITIKLNDNAGRFF